MWYTNWYTDLDAVNEITRSYQLYFHASRIAIHGVDTLYLGSMLTETD